MQMKFLCVLAVFAIVAAMSFSEADACKRCGYDICSGCSQPSYIQLPSIPAPSFPVCDSCSGQYSGPSYLPRRYCGGCLKRKSYRLVDNCNCGC